MCHTQNSSSAKMKLMNTCFRTVVPKVGGIAPLGALRNSRGAVKQKWAIGGR